MLLLDYEVSCICYFIFIDVSGVSVKCNIYIYIYIYIYIKDRYFMLYSVVLPLQFGRAIAQTVTRRLPTAAARVRARAN
jgi:hypothetical protein